MTGVLDLVHRERGSDEVTRDVLPPLPVAGPHPDGTVHVEAGMLPREKKLYPLGVNQPRPQHHLQDTVPEELFQAREADLRQDVEGAVGGESAVRHQDVKMGVKIGEVPECLDAGHHADGNVVPPSERPKTLASMPECETSKSWSILGYGKTRYPLSVPLLL